MLFLDVVDVVPELVDQIAPRLAAWVWSIIATVGVGISGLIGYWFERLRRSRADKRKEGAAVYKAEAEAASAGVEVSAKYFDLDKIENQEVRDALRDANTLVGEMQCQINKAVLAQIKAEEENAGLRVENAGLWGLCTRMINDAKLVCASFPADKYQAELNGIRKYENPSKP